MKRSFKKLSKDELLKKKEELSREYFNLRVNRIVGHIDNPLKLRTLRRDIARLNTRITEFEMSKEA